MYAYAFFPLFAVGIVVMATLPCWTLAAATSFLFFCQKKEEKTIAKVVIHPCVKGRFLALALFKAAFLRCRSMVVEGKCTQRQKE